MLAGLPREVEVTHPVTGRDERITLQRDMLVGLVRLTLYAPEGIESHHSESDTGPYFSMSMLRSQVWPETVAFDGFVHSIATPPKPQQSRATAPSAYGHHGFFAGGAATGAAGAASTLWPFTWSASRFT